jgi:hypothetical protein
MGDNLLDRIAVVDDWFEDLDALAGNQSAPQPADEFLAFTREHRAADDLDPTDVSSDYIHV